MNVPAIHGPTAPFTRSQLSLIQATCVPKVATQAEFDWFIEICKITRLNPLTKQIYLFIFNANKPDKRQFVPVTSIGGFRSISARSGNYRPDNRSPRFEYDKKLKDDAVNPLGMVRAEVSIYQHSHDEWHEIPGEAYYDDYAPIKDIWADDETGKARNTGKRILDPKKEGWRKSRIMLPKCAEAAAHRKGWPEDLSVVYVQEEVDKMHTLDLTATEIVEAARAENRLEKIGGRDALIIDWMDGGELQRVPAGKFADQAMAFLNASKDEPMTVRAFQDRNRHAFREFWAMQPTDALAIKKEIEAIVGSAANAA